MLWLNRRAYRKILTMKPDKLLFMWDFLTPFYSQDVDCGSRINAHKRISIISRLLKGLAPHLQVSEINSSSIKKYFYASRCKNLSADDWVALYDSAPSPRQLAAIQVVCQRALVIGFDLPPLLIRCLEQLDIPYFEFINHPDQFHPALPLGVRSNVLDYGILLEPWILTDDNILYDSDRLDGQYRNNDDPQGIGLFLGQWTYDRAKISNGKLLSLWSYKEQIRDMLAAHDKIIVKLSSEEKDDSEEFLLTRLCPTAILTHRSFYELMKDERIGTVYTINSPVAMVSKSFGKKLITFAPMPYIFSRTDYGAYTPLNDVLSSSDIWMAILSHLLI